MFQINEQVQPEHTDVYVVESTWMSGDADGYENWKVEFSPTEVDEMEMFILTLKWLQANPYDEHRNRHSPYDNPYFDFQDYGNNEDGRKVTDLDWFDGYPTDIKYEGEPAKLCNFNIFFYDKNGNKFKVHYIFDEQDTALQQ